MEQIEDAPWIRQAEMYGYPDYEGVPTEKEQYSESVRESVHSDLKKARDLIQQAARCLEDIDEGTIWEDEIIELYDRAFDLGCDVDKKAIEVERW